MNIFIIYKTIYDEEGGISKLELVEIDKDETMAVRYTKLYNNHVSSDIKSRVQFAYIGTRVN